MMANGVVCAEGSPDELVKQAAQENLEEAFVVLTGQGEETKRSAA
jgi:sodium transport system ATP-binding protein